MTRREFTRTAWRSMLGMLMLAGAVRCSPAPAEPGAKDQAGETGVAGQKEAAGMVVEKLEKPLAEWQEILPPDRYAILFEEGTERAGSSPLNAEKRPGFYICAACRLPLFRSEAKYESGTGWPSFFRPIEGRLETKRDYRLLLPRTEYHCIRCGGHQGHLFKDGPPPTGQRWCNNGVALEFIPDDQPLPALRK